MIGKFKLLISEDHMIVRAGLRALLGRERDLVVVGEADNGHDTLEMVKAHAPDLVLMDIHLQQTNGTDIIEIIKQHYPKTRILVLTQQKSEDSIRNALQAGASGYVLKDATRTELITAVRSALAGKCYLSPSISDKVINVVLVGANFNRVKSDVDALTTRERQVLQLVAQGRTNRFIAEHLNLSIKTVDKHRSNLMRKLDLHNASALTTFAISHGLVSPAEGAEG